VDKVTVTVDLLVADGDLSDEVDIVTHANTEKGVFVVKIESPKRRLGEECVKLSIKVAYPPSLEYFKTFAKVTNLDIKVKSVSEISFEKIGLHTMNGTIAFDDIRVDAARFGVVNGKVEGTVAVLEKIGFGVVNGEVDVRVNPDITDSPVEIKANIVKGSGNFKIPGDSYSGPFRVYTVAGAVNVSAEDKDSLTIEKSKRNFARGYFAEKDVGSSIVLHGLHSCLNLTFV
jgi:DUF4097 and DUF4098 domain-containing protein YvlB